MRFDQYDQIRDMGTDKTNGRFGQVSLWQCKHCGRTWLHYLVEYEAFSGSERYFMGPITLEIADRLSPDAAVEYLDALDWYLYGGSYFDGKGRTTGKVYADL